MRDKPYITYIKRLSALEDRRIYYRFVRAYQRLSKKLVLWLRRKGPVSLEDAEDVSAKAWSEILVAVRSRRLREWFDPIAYRVAWQRCLNHIVVERNRLRLNRGLDTSDVVVEDQDTTIVLKTLIAALPDGERTVIEHVLAGFTQMETATSLGISLSTVKRLEKSAMAWMRSQAR